MDHESKVKILKRSLSLALDMPILPVFLNSISMISGILLKEAVPAKLPHASPPAPSQEGSLKNSESSVGSYVESLGGIYPENDFFVDLLNNNLTKKFNAWSLAQQADKSDVRVLEKSQEAKIINKIKKAKKQGDTLGGTFIAVATGVPVGLGSFTQYDLKLNAEIAHSIMSINAVKGVEIGGGFISSDLFGSENHDEIIIKDNVLSRKTNMAGGIEGGISTGLPIIVRGSMKPIATLMNPLTSVDLHTMHHIESRRERSDFTAVPACAVIAESMLAWSLAKYFLIKFGGDSLEEIKDNYNSYTKKLQSRIKKNFR